MLTSHRIERLIDAGQLGPLVDEILANGRPIELPLHIRLADPEGLTAVALGLALSRVSEITFACSPFARQLVYRLARLQDDQGGFGTVAGTAVALRGLLAVRDQVGSDELRCLLDETIYHALCRLVLWQDEEGGFGDNLDAAIVAWQLGHVREFRESIRWGDFVNIAGDLTLPADAPTISSDRAA